jgi:hypothetical protein
VPTPTSESRVDVAPGVPQASECQRKLLGDGADGSLGGIDRGACDHETMIDAD